MIARESRGNLVIEKRRIVDGASSLRVQTRLESTAITTTTTITITTATAVTSTFSPPPLGSILFVTQFTPKVPTFTEDRSGDRLKSFIPRFNRCR